LIRDVIVGVAPEFIAATLRAGSFFESACSVQESGMKRAKKKTVQTGNMRLRIERAIRAIPRGKVSTYGGVAKMAGYPGAARMVARVLRRGFGLPWQRVLGSGGEIKLTGDSAIEQRLRLEAEGARFRGRKVDMKACEWKPNGKRKVLNPR
jgi:methylated-DNA-protein-cysteine methyltransferase related protein